MRAAIMHTWAAALVALAAVLLMIGVCELSVRVLAACLACALAAPTAWVCGKDAVR